MKRTISIPVAGMSQNQVVEKVGSPLKAVQRWWQKISQRKVEERLTNLTLARSKFFINDSHKGEGLLRPLAISPQIETETRDKNEDVARRETKPFVPDFKVLGQLVTFELRSNGQI